jgi:hypothetical protein
VRLALALLVAAAAGCGGPGGLPGLGEACSFLCAPGLDCSPAKFCVKSCRCEGDAGPTICSPTALATGCPTNAACVPSTATGEGMCAARCADLGCPPGEAACALAPDGTPVCVGPDYPWVGLDGGADQSFDHD